MRRAAMVFLVVTAFAASAATAQVRVLMSGTVTDVLDRPVVGATVSDGNRSTTTAAGGVWSLLVDPALVNTITASKAGYVTVAETVVPLAQSELDFALPFTITPKVSPTVVNALPASLSLEAKSLMPPAGNCMIASDDRTGGEGITMLYVDTDANNVSRWIGSVPLPQGSASGFFHITFEGRSCSTLEALTDAPAGAYVIDASPPGIDIITPAEGFLTIGVIPIPSRDGSTRVFGPVFVQVEATDDVGLKLGSIDVSPPAFHNGCDQDARGATSFRYVCGPFLFLRPGAAYTLTVSVSDLAGKTSTVTRDLLVAGGS